METKLKSISEKIPWFLAAKSILLGFLWAFLPFWFFVLAAVVIYLKSGVQAFKLWVSFALLMTLAYSLGGVELSTFHYAFALLFMVCFFLLFGIKEFFFINRTGTYMALAPLIFLLLAFYNFYFVKLNNFSFFQLAFSAVMLGALFRECYLVLGVNEWPRRMLLVSGSVLIISEMAWAMLFLPVGFLSSTALLLVVFSVFLNIFIDYSGNFWGVKRIILHSVIFSVAIFLISFFSYWKI